MSENKDKISCEVIQDLLLLCQDGECSAASKKLIDEHLPSCAICQSVAECLNNTEVEDRLSHEKDSVLQTFAKKERKRTYTIGVVTAAVLMIPIIVCLICNLAVGHSLDWFFIVLASLAIFASVTVIPLVVEKNVGLWTLGSFTGSLLALLLIINIYTGGRWFLMAAIPIIFSLSVLFAPYVIKRIKLPPVFANKKGVLVMLWDTAWLFAIIVVAGVGNTTPQYWNNALETTAYCVLLPWILFLIIRYSKLPRATKNSKLHGLIKAGICVIVVGVYMTITNNVINGIVGGGTYWYFTDVDFSNWSIVEVINANIWMISLISTVTVGLILVGVGIILQKRKNNE